MTDRSARDAAHEPSVREEALRRLLRIESGGAFIGRDRDAEAGLDERARRQAMEYVAGVTRWRRRLDFLLGHYYRGSLDEMERPLLQILRIGLYDILFLQTPPYAAVSEAVALAKRVVRRGAGGLVNGVLRSVLRNIDSLPIPKTGNPAEDLAIEHSHPTWMVERWLKRYGSGATIELLEWNNRRPRFGIRINTLITPVDEFHELLDRLSLKWERGKYLDHFVTVESVQPLIREGFFSRGLCAVQDESAGLLVQLLGPEPGEVVVDLCAAPGGKAIHSAQIMENQGRVVAVDVQPVRVGLIEEAARQQAAGIVEAYTADARHFNGIPPGSADRVLVDAPCSGLGVLSKRADLRWRRTPDDLSDLVQLQDEILEAASKLVRPGGILVYGTCTIEPEENEERVAAFLGRHPEFSVEDAARFLPTEVTTGLYASTFPPRHGVDGAFGARLIRNA